MVAGQRYNIFDPDLVERRREAKALLRRFNLADAEDERRAILEHLLGHIGRESVIEPPFSCSYGHNTHIGDRVFLNSTCTILDNGGVRIGDRVAAGPMVQIYTAVHPLEADDRFEGWEITRPVVIGDDVWLGGGAILLPGVTIGRGAVVGAGAVVSKDVPPNVVVAGNPARVIREIDREPSGRPPDGAA
jgi:maltose O-acetyltransferase